MVHNTRFIDKESRENITIGGVTRRTKLEHDEDREKSYRFQQEDFLGTDHLNGQKIDVTGHHPWTGYTVDSCTVLDSKKLIKDRFPGDSFDINLSFSFIRTHPLKLGIIRYYLVFLLFSKRHLSY